MSKSFQVLLILLVATISLISYSILVSNLTHSPFKSAIRGWDNSFYYFWLRSPLVDHDFDFSNDINQTETINWPRGKELALNLPLTDKGKIPNKYGIGWAVSSIPFYFLADGIVHSLNIFSIDLPRDGYHPVYQFFILLGQLIYAVLSLFFSYKILCKWFESELALLGVVVGWLSGFMFFYQTYELSMAHNIVYFAITGSYYIAHKIESKPQSLTLWIFLGLLGGLAVISRYQTVIYLIYPALISLKSALSNRKILPLLSISLLFFLLLIFFQLLAWKIVYGSWIKYTYTGESFNWFNPEILNVYFSSFHGLFYWSPAYLLAMAGFLMFVFKRGGLLWSFVFIFFAETYVNASWYCWWFGWSFGSRAFEGCVIFFMIGIAYLLKTVKDNLPLKVVVHLFFILFLFFNIILTFASIGGSVPMEQGVTYHQMINSIINYYQEIFSKASLTILSP
jgi:hypothetical protein